MFFKESDSWAIAKTVAKVFHDGVSQVVIG